VRLFVALHVSNAIRAVVDDLIRELRPLDDSWKWTRAENLHITLKFLGEVAIDKVPSAIEILRNVPGSFSIPLKFHSLGFFPNERRPRVLWVGMDAPQSLSKLAMALDESLAQLGVAREGRDFSPHLTLARGRDAKPSRGFREAVEKCASRVFGGMNATSFHLMESKLKSTGAEYTTLESFPGGPKS
jgi:RNA 2',3'-cyclic 3'-phosphodiesterase